LQSASAPDVPFCAAVKMAETIVLARHSGPERVRPVASTSQAAERSSASCSPDTGGLARLLLLLRPELHLGVWKTRPSTIEDGDEQEWTMSGEVNGDDDLILGWCKDPFGTHELRWITRGTPSSLVRDAQVEANDPPPPDRQPTRPFVPVDTMFGSDDPRRAGQSESGSGIDYGTIAMDANVLYDSSMTPNGVAPSDGRPLSSWPTSFDIKMRKRARKQRRSERWQRWFGAKPS